MQLGAFGKLLLRQTESRAQVLHTMAQGGAQIVHGPASWLEPLGLKIDYRLIYW